MNILLDVIPLYTLVCLAVAVLCSPASSDGGRRASERERERKKNQTKLSPRGNLAIAHCATDKFSKLQQHTVKISTGQPHPLTIIFNTIHQPCVYTVSYMPWSVYVLFAV